MKKIKYYVVYEIWQNGRTIGKGTCEVVLKKRITEKKDIEEIEELALRDKNIPIDCTAVVVNYILMDEVEIDEEGR